MKFLTATLITGVLSLCSISVTAVDQDLFPSAIVIGNSDLKLHGYGEYKFARLIRIYAAALYLPAGTSRKSTLRPTAPKQLDLYYFRTVDKGRIKRTTKSILQRQLTPTRFAQIYPEYVALHETLGDAKRGDRLSVRFDGHKLALYVNDELVSSSTNPALADAYFGIWLHDSPTSDKLREKLLAGVQVDRL